MGRNVGPTPRPLGDLSWMDNAACKGMASALFFPVDSVVRPEAAATCATCPVRGECAAQGRHEPAGVWGGHIAGTDGHTIDSIERNARRLVAVMDRSAWASASALAARAGVNYRVAKIALNWAVDSGLVESSGPPTGRGNATTFYRPAGATVLVGGSAPDG